MKKLIAVFICIILFLFISMFFMVLVDKNNNDGLMKKIINNTNIDDIVYVNKYDDSYIVIDDEYLYLFNFDYVEITKIEVSLIYENKNDYDIVYKDKTIMYMNDYKSSDGLVFEYYDIYTYEFIDKIVVGG